MIHSPVLAYSELIVFRSLLSRFAVAGAALMVAAQVATAEPARRIDTYVEPFYRAGPTASDQPQVNVGRKFDALLASNRREDVLAARDLIVADPKLVTPMTMMVLAIRLYDVGLRDESVFWFYAAKDRFFTLVDVAVPNAPALATAGDSMRSFAALAGPLINGYAFCDLARQQEARARSLAWVKANPYQAIFLPQIPARSSDRDAALAQAIRQEEAGAEKERLYLQDPKNRQDFLDARKRNGADERYCWK